MTIVTKRKLILAAATVLVATAAVGTLSLAGGATGAATPPTHAHSQARAQARKHRHHFSIASFNCSHAERALARIEGAQTDIAGRTAQADAPRAGRDPKGEDRPGQQDREADRAPGESHVQGTPDQGRLGDRGHAPRVGSPGRRALLSFRPLSFHPRRTPV